MKKPQWAVIVAIILSAALSACVGPAGTGKSPDIAARLDAGVRETETLLDELREGNFTLTEEGAVTEFADGRMHRADGWYFSDGTRNLRIYAASDGGFVMERTAVSATAERNKLISELANVKWDDVKGDVLLGTAGNKSYTYELGSGGRLLTDGRERVFDRFGSTVITLPESYTDDTLTEAEKRMIAFNEFIDLLESSRNFTLEYKRLAAPAETYEFDGPRAKKSIDGAEIFYSEEGEITYEYNFSGDRWQKSPSSESMAARIAMFRSAVEQSDIRYDSRSGNSESEYKYKYKGTYYSQGLPANFTVTLYADGAELSVPLYGVKVTISSVGSTSVTLPEIAGTPA